MFDIGKRIAVGDATLYVSEAGKADGEPIVLLWVVEMTSYLSQSFL